MRYRRFGLTFVLGLFLVLQLPGLSLRAAEPIHKKLDVRIMVDVSGSMRRNDPLQLRRPAVNLVTGLLPAGSHAAVGFFGTRAKMMLADAVVTPNWRKKARHAAARIHARDMRTNIGAALEAATGGWDGTDTSTRRVVILLTDGMVDISPDAGKNALERERIQTQVIPRLKKIGAKVYTIALSNGADKELMAQLANATGAWYETADSADALEKVFLKIFGQSTNVPVVPIRGHRFLVDRSVKEFTALLFRTSGAPLILQTPKGQKLDSETLDQDLTWYSDLNFDLITVRRPTSGQWTILGELDPDNKVMVVSDLVLDVNNAALPASVLGGDKIPLSISLREKGRVIKRPSFLKLVQFNGLIKMPDGKEQDLVFEDSGMGDDKTAGDGIFGYSLKAGKTDGELRIQINIASPTFERSFQRSIRVFANFIKISTTIAHKSGEPHRVIVVPIRAVTESHSLLAEGSVVTPLGKTLALTFKPGKNGAQIAALTPAASGGEYKITLSVKGKTLSGRDFSVGPKTLKFTAPALEPVKSTKTEPAKDKKDEQNLPEKSSKADKNQDKKTATASPKTKTKAVVKAADKDQKDKDSATKPPVAVKKKHSLALIWWIIFGVILNIVVFGGSYFAWRWWQKRQQQAGDALAKELDQEGTSAKDKK